jgi:exodeoxyribonuclease-3
VRIATWNVNSLKARLARVEQWLAADNADVVLLQETKLAQEAFPHLAIQALGYEAAHCGEGRWNGVAILSRVGLADVQLGFADGEAADPEARLISATCDGIRVMSVYVPNGRALDNPHYEYKLRWMARLRAHLDATCSPADNVAVGGDFNIAPDDRDVWNPAAFIGATHVSEPEREALRSLYAWGLRDTFRDHNQEPGNFSWWDYRGGSFHKKEGLRIDLILATHRLADLITDVRTDREARKGQQPSDHAPVVATIAG